MSFPLHGFYGDTAATWDGDEVFIWGTDAGTLETAHGEKEPVYWGNDVAIWIIGPFEPLEPGVLGDGGAAPGGGPAPKIVVLPRRRPRRREEEPEPQPAIKPTPKLIRKTDAQTLEALTVELPPDMTRQGLEEIVTAFRRSLEAQEAETKARRRREDEDILTLLQAALAAGVFDERH